MIHLRTLRVLLASMILLLVFLPYFETVTLSPAVVDIVVSSVEDRTAAVSPQPSFTPPLLIAVSSVEDSGPGTLRDALLIAASGSRIFFSTTTFPPDAPATIALLSVLPALDDGSVTIDASNAGVILDGAQAQAGADGLRIESQSNVIHGLTIQNFDNNGIFVGYQAENNGIENNVLLLNGSNGIDIRGNDNAVYGNLIGITPESSSEHGNRSNGIAIWDGASGNVVGDALGDSPILRNVISGNGENGVWLGSEGTTNNFIVGNFIGTSVNGQSAVANSLAGVAIQSGAQDNHIGGLTSNTPNIISGNASNGIYISDPNTSDNDIIDNIIGLADTGHSVIGQGLNGIVINNAPNTLIIGNVISGSDLDGVVVLGNQAQGNIIQSNYVGTNAAGNTALANGLHGVELRDGAHDNLIGGNQPGEGNLLSGNNNHGLVITKGAHDNQVQGNLIGPDATGSSSLGGHPFGGIDIAEGAYNNVIGGLGVGERNVISGNRTDGIALFGNETRGNQVLGNLIGLAADGTSPLPNMANAFWGDDNGAGIFNLAGAVQTLIQRNTVAYNEGHGVVVSDCAGNQITQNAIYANGGKGIDSTCPHNVSLRATSLTDITGTTSPNARVELFSDDEFEGAVYEGSATADNTGSFAFSKSAGFSGANVTAVSIDADGNTSGFSPPLHLEWTFLLYLNGDNDLEPFVLDARDNIVAAGPSPRANVLVLLDQKGDNNTIVYDLTTDEPIILHPPFNAAGELNMGDGATLAAFVNWARARNPSQHTLLSILDHGGGWAPSSEIIPPGALPITQLAWLNGNSGLSWDFSADYDYLDSQEMRQTLAEITADGGVIDVLFYDVCLMGLAEVAYQIKDYAAYFVASQNIGWAPQGAEGRYVRIAQTLPPGATPRQVAELLVTNYASGIAPELHPYTISALDLSQMSAVGDDVSHLAQALQAELDGDRTAAEALYEAYRASQKMDYDSSLSLEVDKDGFVDLYDFAGHVQQRFPLSAVALAAQDVQDTLDTAIVAEEHQSGSPWVKPAETWNFAGANGLSIFLPLGEDLELPITITETTGSTRNLRLRDLYTAEQLQFVGDTGWGELITTYYDIIAPPPEEIEGPLPGLQPVDITPPTTAVSYSGRPGSQQVVEIFWEATDTESAVAGATLWHRTYQGEWINTGRTQEGAAGKFQVTLGVRFCQEEFAVRSLDFAGNEEPLASGANGLIFACSLVPILPAYGNGR